MHSVMIGLGRHNPCTLKKNKMPRTISMFDWNGDLLEEAKSDELKFGITLKPISDGVMGHQTFEISGPKDFIADFLSHYELELD